jgi:sarcosine oxidase subunit gamma
MPDAAPPLSPLHHLGEPQWRTASGSVVLADRSLRGKFVLHGKPDDPALQEAATAAFALTLPPVNKAAEADGRTLAWLGPREWLALCPADQETAAAAALRAAGVSHVSVGHGRALISLSGSDARDLLRKATSLDVHPRNFAPGDCAQTRLARLAVLLIPREPPAGFDILCDRGFAEYLWLWFKDAAREFEAA